MKTEPGAVVAYVAIYSDGKAGAEPPFGAGYGGNAGGKAGPDGVYTSSWTLKPNTPAGPARVEVAAGAHGERGKATALFTVTGATDRCPGGGNS